MEFEIGDTIKITNTGHQYTTYVEMAIKLGAGVSKYISKHLSENQGSHRHFDYDIAKKDRSCKWIYDGQCTDGDVCKLLNMDGDHYLVERIFDGRQFLMAEYGIKFVEKSAMFNDGDFLL